MNSITTKPDLLAFVKDQLNGSNLSIRGVARLCGVDDMAIIRSADFASKKLATILTASDFKAADLTQNGFPPKAVWLTIEYFAYESKAKAEMAKQIARTFGMLGVIQTFSELNEIDDEVIEIHEPVQHELPKRDAVDYAYAASEVNKLSQGILKQLVYDSLVDQISLERNLKYLPVAEKPKQYTICKVRAKMLGYSDEQIGNGSALGRFVRSRVEPSFQEQIGKYPVFHYEINHQLDEAITSFFDK